MTRVTVSVQIPVPPRQVWACLADLASHPEWMSDAEGVEFVGSRTEGVGTRMRVGTRVGPLHTVDVMEVVEWDEPHRLAVSHRGVVRGHGRFELTATGGGTVVTWTEDLSFPWYLGGPVTGCFARPVLRRLWKKNLERFRRRVASV